jgi:hypothetical protein
MHSFRKIPIDILVEGDREHGYVMPNPNDIKEKRSGVWYANLKALLALKVMAGRENDISDIRNLVKANNIKTGVYRLADIVADQKFKSIMGEGTAGG